MIDLLGLILGFIGGFAVGISGVGSGSLVTPLLIMIGLQPTIAVGTNLAFAAITRSAGALQHLRQHTVDFGLAKAISYGVIPTTLLGVLSIVILHFNIADAVQRFLPKIIGLVLLLTTGLLLANRTSLALNGGNPSRRVGSDLMVGSVVGLTSSITSVGSGSILLPYLVATHPSVQKTVGTIVFVSAISTGLAGMGYLLGGMVQGPLLASLVAGSLPGIILGTKLIRNVSAEKLRFGISLITLVAGLGLLIK